MDAVNLHDDATMRLVAAQNVLLVHVKQPLDVEHVHLLDGALANLSRHNPQGVAMLAVTMTGVKVIESGVREAASNLLQNHERELVAVAVVLGAEGVLATLMRSIVSTITAAARFKRVSVFDNLAQATLWLGDQLAASGPMAPRAAELAQAMKECMGATRQG